jgi:glycerophosphoryl diester phosphodiesterase
MKIYAHRGAHIGLTEMSMSAYQAAIAQGADGFECDVRLTADQEIICWHDADTARITGKRVTISSTRFADLSFANPVRLEDLLQLAISAKKDLAIETKHPVSTGGLIEKAVLALLYSYEEEINKSGIAVTLMSFSWRAMQRCKETSVDTTFLFKWKFLASTSMTPIVGPSITLIRSHPEIVKELHDEGKRIFVWTVNEESDIELCLRLGVDAIATDNPALARKVLR